jgi:hypothetical protein
MKMNMIKPSKKKVLIVFPACWVAYSNTVLNLYDVLQEYFDVELVFAEYYTYIKQNSVRTYNFIQLIQEKRNIIILDMSYKVYLASRIIWRIIQKIIEPINNFLGDNKILGLVLAFDAPTLHRYLTFSSYFSNIDKKEISYVIAVNPFCAFTAQKFFEKISFLSHEIIDNDYFFENLDAEKIDSVIIHSPERYQHLFGNKKLKTFYIHNSVFFDCNMKDLKKNHEINPFNLIYNGTAQVGFGLLAYLNFIDTVSDYFLTIKGQVNQETISKFTHLIEGNRLIIDENYMEHYELRKYISQFSVGFCFYDIDDTQNHPDTFNYITAPSGKLFVYLASGVPVLCNEKIKALHFIQDKGAGVLIKDIYNPLEIKEALDKINNNYDLYVNNAFALAEEYSFEKFIQPLILEINRACK